MTRGGVTRGGKGGGREREGEGKEKEEDGRESSGVLYMICEG